MTETRKLDWTESNGDYRAKGYLYDFDIEQASEDSFWTFMDGRPVGTYKTLPDAQQRCEQLEEKTQP